MGAIPGECGRRRRSIARLENPLFPLVLVDRPTALARGPAAEEPAEWHRAVAPGSEVGEITTHGLALSRPRRGFESRWGHQTFWVEVFREGFPSSSQRRRKALVRSTPRSARTR